MTNRLTCLAIAVSATALFAPAPSRALEDTANGKRLAQQWCMACHLVAPDQKQAMADAPPFAAIAKRPDEELARLKSFLVDPHPKMPNFNLSRQEIADIVAYIRSLSE